MTYGKRSVITKADKVPSNPIISQEDCHLQSKELLPMINMNLRKQDI